MNNYENIINLTPALQGQDDDTIASTILPVLTQSDNTMVDSIHRHLLTLPVLLPFELDQLLDDNDAFIDVIHGLLKVNRALDVIPYLNRLNDNLMVLSHHYEVYSRAFENTIGLYVDDEEESQSSSNTTGNNNDANADLMGMDNNNNSKQRFNNLSSPFQDQNDNQKTLHNNPLLEPLQQFKQLNDDKNVDEQNEPITNDPNDIISLPPNYYAINSSALYYTEQQLHRAQDLLALFDLYGIDKELSDKIHKDHVDFEKWLENGGKRLGKVKGFSTKPPVLRKQIGGRKRAENIVDDSNNDNEEDGHYHHDDDDEIESSKSTNTSRFKKSSLSKKKITQKDAESDVDEEEAPKKQTKRGQKLNTKETNDNTTTATTTTTTMRRSSRLGGA